MRKPVVLAALWAGMFATTCIAGEVAVFEQAPARQQFGTALLPERGDITGRCE